MTAATTGDPKRVPQSPPAMLVAVLATWVSLCAACGAAPGNGSPGGPATNHDPNFRTATIERSESAAPTRDVERSRNAEKSGKGK